MVDYMISVSNSPFRVFLVLPGGFGTSVLSLASTGVLLPSLSIDKGWLLDLLASTQRLCTRFRSVLDVFSPSGVSIDRLVRFSLLRVFPFFFLFWTGVFLSHPLRESHSKNVTPWAYAYQKGCSVWVQASQCSTYNFFFQWTASGLVWIFLGLHEDLHIPIRIMNCRCRKLASWICAPSILSISPVWQLFL